MKTTIFCGDPMRLMLVLALLVSPGVARATDDNFGLWTVFTTTDTFPTEAGTSRWSYWFDAQARLPDLGSGATQFLVRPAVGYRPGDNLQFWAGYARIESENAAGVSSHENRFWQQVNWKAGSALGGTITMRTRLMERSLSTGNDTALVLRFMTKYTRPIGSGGDKNLVFSIEPFYDLRDTDWGGDSGFAQNRSVIGVSWKLNDKVTMTTSYMNQFVWRDSGEDSNNHIALLNFNVKF